MRISVLTTIVLAGFWDGASAFQPTKFAATRSVAIKAGRADLHEFDFILGEGNSDSSQQQTVIRSRRKVQLPSNSDSSRATVLASSTFAAPGLEELEDAVAEEEDPYADILEESSTLSRYEQPEQSFTEKASSKLEQMDWQDIISTLIVPGIFAFAGLRWGAKKVTVKMQLKAEESLDAFASEMVYHDGDFEEMKLCLNSYSSKFVWLGPNKTPVMLKRYLQLYSKKKTVSPQSIR